MERVKPTGGLHVTFILWSFLDDVETLSNSDVSDDLLDDFEVVPLPDCFDPSKPLNLERKSSVTGTQVRLITQKVAVKSFFSKYIA